MSLMSNRLELPFFVHYGLAIIMFWFNMAILFIGNPLTPQIFNDSIYGLIWSISTGSIDRVLIANIHPPGDL